MVIVIDLLCPDRNDSPPESPMVTHTDEERKIDRSRVTRLQLINIKGELVDVEN